MSITIYHTLTDPATDEAFEFEITCTMAPAEPDVGIPRPYIDGYDWATPPDCSIPHEKVGEMLEKDYDELCDKAEEALYAQDPD